jgi:ubiquitin
MTGLLSVLNTSFAIASQSNSDVDADANIVPEDASENIEVIERLCPVEDSLGDGYKVNDRCGEKYLSK